MIPLSEGAEGEGQGNASALLRTVGRCLATVDPYRVLISTPMLENRPGMISIRMAVPK
jgi:hypothetical protein